MLIRSLLLPEWIIGERVIPLEMFIKRAGQRLLLLEYPRYGEVLPYLYNYFRWYRKGKALEFKHFVPHTILVAFLLFLFLPASMAYEEPVGILPYDSDYLLGWNQGSIANETYYNASSGLYQFANLPERAADVTYSYGFAKKILGVMHYWYRPSFPSDIDYNSDFITYYWVSSNYSMLADTANITLWRNNTQNVSDDYVTMWQRIKANIALSGDNYYLRLLAKPDVGSDGRGDVAHLLQSNGSEVVFLAYDNTSMAVVDVLRFALVGANYSYFLNFEKEQTLYFNKTVQPSVNGDFYFVEPIGTMQAGINYNSSNEWIDASCGYSCLAGCIVSVTSNFSTGAKLLTGENVSATCSWNSQRVFGAPGDCNCTITPSCGLYAERNISGGWQTLNYNPTYPVVCALSETCFVLNPPNATTYKYNMTASTATVGVSLLRCSMVGTESSGVYNVTSRTNATIWSPVDNNITAASTITFKANWTGTRPNNMTLYLNNTKNVTQTNMFVNFSQNVNFDVYGSWKWDVLKCLSHVCEWSWNGNYTITRRPNLQLDCYRPLENADFRNQSWVYFAANWSGTTPDNFSLYIGPALANITNSAYFNQSASAASNFSVNITNFTSMRHSRSAIYWDVIIRKDDYTTECPNFNLQYFSKDYKQNTVLDNPNNKSILNSTPVWFRANVTGDYPSRLELWLSQVGNPLVSYKTYSASTFVNDNVTLAFGNYSWDVAHCVNDSWTSEEQCALTKYSGYNIYNDSGGNFTFYLNISNATPPTISGVWNYNKTLLIVENRRNNKNEWWYT